MMAGNPVTRHWLDEKQELPGSNCLVYADGNMTILNCYSLYNPNNGKTSYFCEPLCDTTIDSFEKYKTNAWVLVDEWVSIPYQNGKIIGGEGTMGSDGFIARVDESNRLVWGMFFAYTNPIKVLEIKTNILTALNEHSELRIEINLDELTDIQITTTDIHSLSDKLKTDVLPLCDA